MAYNNINLYRKIIEIQDIVLEHRKHYTPLIHIYNLHIKNRYYISYGTFSTYLGVPAKALLKKMMDEKEQKIRDAGNQTELKFDDQQ